MGASKTASARLHDAMHQLPGMPAHDQAADLNSTEAPRLRNRPLQNRDAHHANSPRFLPRWQAWIGRRLGQGD